MKNILLILILFLSACKSVENTDVSITNKIENVISDTTKQLNDSVVVNLDTVFVNEIQVIRDKDINSKDEKKAIEQHEKKTNLKVIDKTSNKVDTNKGWIAYSVVENMKVAKSYSVKIRISKLKQNKAVLILGDNDAINNPEYESIATIDDIKVSGEMSAELRGDSETFNIVSLSTVTQNIDNESYTEWEWIVTPKKSGDTPLKLVIKLKELNKDIIVFNKTIKVKSNVPVVFESFFEKYWQWIMTTIIIPIFIFFWNRNKKRASEI
jgi:hypothetical protein